MSYPYYLQIKDKICFLHEGYSSEYIAELNILHDTFSNCFPQLNIFYACRPEFFQFINDKQIVDKSSIEKNHYNYIFEINYNGLDKKHPILNLIKRSELKPIPSKHIGSIGKTAYICPEGNFPNKNLEPKDIEIMKRYALSQSLEPIVVGTSICPSNLPVNVRPSITERKNMASNAGMILGQECDMLFYAASLGIPTAISKNSICKDLYTLLVEKPIIL